MEFPALQAISPVDGRYRKQTSPLADYFSEAAIIRYRLKVEIEYFIALLNLKLPQLEGFPKEKISLLQEIYLNFNLEKASAVKVIEQTTNHDIKAVENYLREQWDQLGIGDYKEFIHFGLTSQDINNTAFPLAIKEAFDSVYLPQLDAVRDKMWDLAYLWKDIPMLAHTHGQPASPTLLGKELMVFVERLDSQTAQFSLLHFSGKFGGATGNLNAHYAAFPHIDWISFSDSFLRDTLGLMRQQHTTQIEHYDDLGAFFDICKRINTIFIDFSRDIWTYISLDYFSQRIIEQEVGSSTMPHKVNPIDFENAEGNLGIANALFEHFTAKLPVSRLQRDLTDSTVIRNIGVPFGHGVIAFQALLRGLEKLILNEATVKADLENNWAVVSEAIQTILRREKYPEPYQVLKELTRGKSKLSQQDFVSFIDSLSLDTRVKEELKQITPFTYTGKTAY